MVGKRLNGTIESVFIRIVNVPNPWISKLQWFHCILQMSYTGYLRRFHSVHSADNILQQLVTQAFDLVLQSTWSSSDVFLGAGKVKRGWREREEEEGGRRREEGEGGGRGRKDGGRKTRHTR